LAVGIEFCFSLFRIFVYSFSSLWIDRQLSFSVLSLLLSTNSVITVNVTFETGLADHWIQGTGVTNHIVGNQYQFDPLSFKPTATGEHRVKRVNNYFVAE